jgi:hypothetical protein
VWELGGDGRKTRERKMGSKTITTMPCLICMNMVLPS